MRSQVLALIAYVGLLAGLYCGPAAAHSPYFSQSEAISVPGYDTVTLRLLHGDGIVVADPVRAVVVDRDGRLLGASPMSAVLGMICESETEHPTCKVYDGVSGKIYEPAPAKLRDGGVIEIDGRPQAYPEDMTTDFGFEERPASLAETVRFEIQQLLSSWMATILALAWWALFWGLAMPLIQAVLGRRRRPRALAIVLRLAGVALMAPITALAWLLSPYSLAYLAVVVTGGALLAYLFAKPWRTATA